MPQRLAGLKAKEKEESSQKNRIERDQNVYVVLLVRRKDCSVCSIRNAQNPNNLPNDDSSFIYPPPLLLLLL